MRYTAFIALLTAAFLPVVGGKLRAEENVLLTELTTKGITVGADTLKLSPPIMADGLDAAAQKKVIESIAEGPRTFDALVKKGLAAPHIIKQETSGALRKVDVYFVAYGDLDHLMMEGFHDFKPATAKDPVLKSDVIDISDAPLAERKITRQDERDYYYHAYFPLIEKVLIRATIHAMESRSEDSVLIASTVDDRFAKDAKYPNVWQGIVEMPAGKFKLDAMRHEYSGAGICAKATQLKEPKGAIFVEYHLVYHQPAGWPRDLTGKIPLAAQDSIKKLRIQLEKEEKRAIEEAAKKPESVK